MKERPIIFSGPMVRAILDGKKTQTRRLAALRLEGETDGAGLTTASYEPDRRNGWGRCQPGDRLWVREGWGYRGTAYTIGQPTMEVLIDYRADGELRRIDRAHDDRSGLPKQVCRCKGGGESPEYGPSYEHQDELTRFWAAWRSPRFMPRWASRLLLEVTAVRVERLQACGTLDAMAEGMPQTGGEAHALGLIDLARTPGHEWDNRTSVENFARLWDTINGKRAPWASNPWVWVIEFRRAEAQEAAA